MQLTPLGKERKTLNPETIMSDGTSYLRHMCRPNEATDIEIVQAAWQVAREQNLSTTALREKLRQSEAETITRAGIEMVKQLGKDGLGFYVGTDLEMAMRTPNLSIPRRFIFELASMEDSSPPDEEMTIQDS